MPQTDTLLEGIVESETAQSQTLSETVALLKEMAVAQGSPIQRLTYIKIGGQIVGVQVAIPGANRKKEDETLANYLEFPTSLPAKTLILGDISYEGRDRNGYLLKGFSKADARLEMTANFLDALTENYLKVMTEYRLNARTGKFSEIEIGRVLHLTHWLPNPLEGNDILLQQQKAKSELHSMWSLQVTGISRDEMYQGKPVVSVPTATNSDELVNQLLGNSLAQGEEQKSRTTPPISYDDFHMSVVPEGLANQGSGYIVGYEVIGNFRGTQKDKNGVEHEQTGYLLFPLIGSRQKKDYVGMAHPKSWYYGSSPLVNANSGFMPLAFVVRGRNSGNVTLEPLNPALHASVWNMDYNSQR